MRKENYQVTVKAVKVMQQVLSHRASHIESDDEVAVV